MSDVVPDGAARPGRDAAGPIAPGRAAGTGLGRMRWLVSPMVLVGIPAVVSTGLAAALYLTEQRPDTQIDDAAARSAVRAASEGAVAVLSYTPDSLDRDLAAAKSHLTGDFLAYYSEFSGDVLEPTAKQKQITNKASVVRAAVSELHSDTAKVLVFVNQISNSNEKPLVAMGNSVIVSLTKSDGSWLISGFQPV